MRSVTAASITLQYLWTVLTRTTALFPATVLSFVPSAPARHRPRFVALKSKELFCSRKLLSRKPIANALEIFRISGRNQGAGTKSSTSTSRTFSSLTFSAAETESSEEDLLRWERMYNEGRSFEQSPMDTGNVRDEDATGGTTPRRSNFLATRSEVRVISFDLDNTLWRTGATIAAANDSCAAYLDQKNIVQKERVEHVMGHMFKANKQRYCPIDPDTAKAPVLLSLLRKDAIQKVLMEDNNYTEEEAASFAETVFEEWMAARHEATLEHLADSVVTTLEQISSLRTSAGHAVLIGAITDGNSDPRLIECLSSYFDFCVNAETVGIGKPDKRIFMHAVKQLITSHPALQDLVVEKKAATIGGKTTRQSVESMGDEEIEALLGPWWVHVGDDFVKDIVAAKSLNMRSIWARELVLDHQKTLEDKNKLKNNTKSSSRKIEDFVKEVSEMKVIKMQVGSEDYLAEGLQNEFADAVVDRFEDLTRLLREWHEEGLEKNALPSPINGEAKTTTTSVEPVKSEAKSTTIPVGNSMGAVADVAQIQTVSSKPARDTKFCVFCGGKLPVVAKFCSECGEKQPAID